jgi:hypothetical protein
MAKIFYTPPGYTGQAELTASTGLAVVDQGLWRFSQAGYNDGATFGLSLTAPSPTNGGNLDLSATDWPIATVGNELTSYTDPDSGQTYPPSQCRIQVIGRWQIVRQPNSNSFNSIGVTWAGHTHTDQGDRAVGPYLLNYISDYAVYVIQGADVTGGAQDTFSNHDFYCNFTESATTDNSNKEFQSNTIIRPIWAYTYTKSWEITA